MVTTALKALQCKNSRAVGKDEVGGSNPPSSSIETPEIFGFWVFSFDFCNFCGQLKFLDKF